MYLAASKLVVSVILLKLSLDESWLPIYYVTCQVNVLTDVPLWAILHMAKLSRWLIKWVVELSEFGVMEWWILYVDGASCGASAGIGIQAVWLGFHASNNEVKYEALLVGANGQVEVMNKSLLDALKKMLQGADRCWVEELPRVLWAHRTT
ncbi:hypothetical protein AAG906_025818 [Vitis piasezkii]